MDIRSKAEEEAQHDIENDSVESSCAPKALFGIKWGYTSEGVNNKTRPFIRRESGAKQRMTEKIEEGKR